MDCLDEAREIGRLRRRKRERQQRGIGGAVGDDRAGEARERFRQRHGLAAPVRRGESENRMDEAPLRGVPPVDGVAVVRGEERELRLRVVELEAHRSGESAQ